MEAEDPFRLDNLDTYSNLLYVKEMRVELSHLAHRVVQVDKYRVETCCVIGEEVEGGGGGGRWWRTWRRVRVVVEVKKDEVKQKEVLVREEEEEEEGWS